MTPALIATIIDLLKRTGLLPDKEAEEKAREALRYASGQFLTSTSGPIYAIARIFVIGASLWDVFFNGARSWAATQLPPVLELVPVFWLFLGPEIVAPAVQALGQAFAQRPLQPLQKPAQPSILAEQPEKPDKLGSGTNPPSAGGNSATKPAPFTSGSRFKREPRDE